MKTVLITGTNRGIGLGLVKTLISGNTAPKHVIATCRKPGEATVSYLLSQCTTKIVIPDYRNKTTSVLTIIDWRHSCS